MAFCSVSAQGAAPVTAVGLAQGRRTPSLPTDDYLLLYVLRGAGRFIPARGLPEELLPGAALQVGPGSNRSRANLGAGGMRLIIDDPDSFACAFVQLSAPLARGLVAAGLIDPYRTVLRPGLEPAVLEQIEQMAQTLQAPSPATLRQVTLAAQHVIVQLHDLDQSRAVTDPDGQVVERCCAVLETMTDRPLHLEELAQTLERPVAYLRDIFVHRTGLTLEDYHLRRRLDQARQLIAEGKLHWSEAARQVGVPDLGRFERLFRQLLGQRPQDLNATTTP